LGDLLDAGQIERFELLHIRPDIDFPVRITPEAFRRWVQFTLVVTKFSDTSACRALAGVLGGTKAVKDPVKFDVRWGLIFYDKYGAVRGTIYLDAWARLGQIDNIGFKAGPSLMEWLRSLVQEGFEKSVLRSPDRR
jgi:hypothetical protein